MLPTTTSQPTDTPIETVLSLNLPASVKLQVTPEQFAAIAPLNRDIRLELTAKGELLVNPPTGWETGERNSTIVGELYFWWRNAGKPGKVFESSTGFTLPNGAILSPDASWVSDDRWATLISAQNQTFARVCPDFVVELRSQSDTVKGLKAKMREYRDNGTRLGWFLNPKNKSVEIYRADGAVEVLSNPAELSGEDVLPGFTLKLGQVWG